MALDKRLLEILVCPVTKVPVQPLSRDRLAILNRSIEQGEIKFVDGTPLRNALEAALITTDGKTIYRIDGGIPVMLEAESIVASQVPGW